MLRARRRPCWTIIAETRRAFVACTTMDCGPGAFASSQARPHSTPRKGERLDGRQVRKAAVFGLKCLEKTEGHAHYISTSRRATVLRCVATGRPDGDRTVRGSR